MPVAAHVEIREYATGAVARIRNALATATHTFFQQHGFLYVHTPIVTCSDCEGAGEMFQVGRGSGLGCRARVMGQVTVCLKPSARVSVSVQRHSSDELTCSSASSMQRTDGRLMLPE